MNIHQLGLPGTACCSSNVTQLLLAIWSGDGGKVSETEDVAADREISFRGGIGGPDNEPLPAVLVGVVAEIPLVRLLMELDGEGA